MELSWENSRATEKIHHNGVFYISEWVTAEVGELTILPLPCLGYITWIALFFYKISRGAKWESELE